MTVATLLALSIAACAQKRADRDSAPSPAAAASMVASAGSASGGGAAATAGIQAPVEAGRKVIRTGKVELVVDTFDDARGKLDALVRGAGGYIDSTDVMHAGDIRHATVVVRIPAEAFGDVVAKLGDIGKVASEATSAQDITDQYVDVSARLASTQALEKRLLELVADRTANVDQVLTIEREIARVRGDIESYEGHVRQWNDQMAMSTLTLAISTARLAPTESATSATLGDRSARSFRGSVDALAETGSSLLVGLLALIPWLVIGVPCALIGRRAWRRWKPRMPVAIAMVQHQPPQPQPPIA